MPKDRSYLEEGKGALWKNKAQRPSHRDPDFTGQFTIDGKTHYISAYLVDGAPEMGIQIKLRTNGVREDA